MNRIDYLQAVVESQRSPIEVFMNLNEKPESGIIVDVRIAEKAFLQEKIKGALEISLIELPSKLDQLPQGRTIYVTTWSGACTLAKQASLLLLDAGFSVIEIGGGNVAWKESGLPMEEIA
ncbi:hypothetical protein ATZ33_14875 [Enterococcus silesiacus]|uniref:Rhodanese domain-containing protein n=1 Tax=Enterococcus silesiacus TaxID=332949 RepID=A0A0S3KE69_9ENTE|nr:rhodanese-like domain-containing protein [Enterococcus silesiacus]ALS02611.1 hypothetical protein ATZ33_14875 [Enterococcus silesiacus]OJG93463.1 hypothetical protein RV15_GL000065 [Enterococcus silesiacus]